MRWLACISRTLLCIVVRVACLQPCDYSHGLACTSVHKSDILCAVACLQQSDTLSCRRGRALHCLLCNLTMHASPLSDHLPWRPHSQPRRHSNTCMRLTRNIQFKDLTQKSDSPFYDSTPLLPFHMFASSTLSIPLVPEQSASTIDLRADLRASTTPLIPTCAPHRGRPVDQAAAPIPPCSSITWCFMMVRWA